MLLDIGILCIVHVALRVQHVKAEWGVSRRCGR